FFFFFFYIYFISVYAMSQLLTSELLLLHLWSVIVDFVFFVFKEKSVFVFPQRFVGWVSWIRGSCKYVKKFSLIKGDYFNKY
ncbi:hypothetical protein, partial [Escherichia coli]|uniref:hypothetical protein n=1 Tax=Escherichia coli TaxID=562 RepID=UPI001BAECF3E